MAANQGLNESGDAHLIKEEDTFDFFEEEVEGYPIDVSEDPLKIEPQEDVLGTMNEKNPEENADAMSPWFESSSHAHFSETIHDGFKRRLDGELQLPKNSVEYLLKNPFSLQTLEAQCEIKALGRHTPSLDIKQEGMCKGRKYNRRFQTNIYTKHEWICGCPVKKAVFCFPCILFGGESAWTKTGVTDLSHLNEYAKRHGSSQIHISNSMNLAVLGKTSIPNYFSDAYRKSVIEHNEKVSNNRYILSVIINCIRFCDIFALPLRGHDESESSSNPGVFRGLIDLSAELDNSLKSHLEKATFFEGTSKIIQNEILQCILEVYREEVKAEIENAKFLSVIADETTDVSNIYQLSLIYRYTVEGRPVERFGGFFPIENHNADSTANVLKAELSTHLQKNSTKLISQSYDGASFMSGSPGGVQTKIQDVYPNAYFIHCYAHQLNLIVQQATAANRNVRIFFANISGICSFFSTSTQATQSLDKIVHRRLPGTSATRWNFTSRSVNTIYEHYEELCECFQDILNDENIKMQSTIDRASAYKRIIEESNFLRWLKFFHQILPQVDFLYDQMQNRDYDPIKVNKAIKNFNDVIKKIRKDLPAEKPIRSQPPTKRQRPSNSRAEENEILDIILMQVNERFKFKKHLAASNLLLFDKFDSYSSVFPSKYFNEAMSAFPFLDAKKLKTELEIVYKRSEFKTLSGGVPFLIFLKQNNLENIFSEVCQLLNILITIPMSTPEAERSFSTLRRIKTFLKSAMTEDRLSALAVLAIERHFISSIKEFTSKVIEKFTGMTDRRMDFVYEM